MKGIAVTRVAVRWAAVAAVAAATLAVSACSGSTSGGTNFPTNNVLPTGIPSDTLDPSISGSALLTASLNDVGKAKSFRLVETTVNKNITTHFDMRYGSGGAAGTITTGKSTLQVIHIGDSTYVKAPDGFWQTQLNSAQQAKYGRSVHNAWVKVPLLGTTFGQLSAFTDKSQVVEALLKKDTSSFVRGPKAKVDGVAVVRLTDTQKGTTVYVATVGTPYPIAVISGKATNSSAHFSLWNQPYVPAPPATFFTLPAS